MTCVMVAPAATGERLRRMRSSELHGIASLLANQDRVLSDPEQTNRAHGLNRLQRDLGNSTVWLREVDGRVAGVVYIEPVTPGMGQLHGWFFTGRLHRGLIQSALDGSGYPQVVSLIPDYARPVGIWLERKLGFVDTGGRTRAPWHGRTWTVRELVWRKE